MEPLIQPQPRSRNLEKVPNDLLLERLEEEKKAETGLPKDILATISKMKYTVPFLQVLLTESPGVSDIDILMLNTVQVIETSRGYARVYPFHLLLEDSALQLQLQKEYAVLKTAKDENLKHVIQLEALLFGKDHLALVTPKHQMTLRDYLHLHREANKLKAIMLQVCDGLLELHGIDFIHRDLKPENIVLDERPLTVKIIDFNRVQHRRQATKGYELGTPGYFPATDQWRDGSTQWDIWALGAIILECDMPIDEYLEVRHERGAQAKASKHLEQIETNTYVKRIVRGTILRGRGEDMISIERIKSFLVEAAFRRYRV